MAIIHVTNANFKSEVLESQQPVLVDFWATWCGPCRMIAPILEEIAAERDDIKICKVDVDQCYDLAGTYQVSSIPTLLVFKNGEITNKAVGAMPKADLLKLL